MMQKMMVWLLLVMLGTSVLAQNFSATGRDYSSYTDQNYGYGEIDHSGQYGAVEKWPYPSASLIPSFHGCSKGGFWTKAGLVALVAVALLKLPLLFALKFLLLKLTLPLGFLLAAAPVALPLIYMLLPSRNSGGDTPAGSTTQAPMGRSARSSHPLSDPLLAFLRNTECPESLACTLGNWERSTPYTKTISWMLGEAKRFTTEEDSRQRVEAYRDAYLEGATSKGGACLKYKCSMPRLILQHGKTNFPVRL